MMDIDSSKMNDIELKEELLAYDKTLLHQWKQGNIDFLLNSSASNYIKKIIRHKKREGSKRRYQEWYFGESYVATQKGDTVKYGWFNSYHWLAEEEWADENYIAPREKFPIDEELKTEFHLALQDHIDLKVVRNIQEQANILYNNFRKDLEYSKPKVPDLWLIDKTGQHQFIEVKMRPRDTAKNHQVAGLVVLYMCLNASVKVVRLYEREKSKPEENYYSKVFNRYYSFLRDREKRIVSDKRRFHS